MSSKEKILLVYDQFDSLSLLSSYLRHQGYDIYESIDGNAAISLAQEIQPDLILLDLIKSDISSYQICLSLKKIELTKDIPLIIVSSLKSRQNKVQNLETEGIEYITKPLDIDKTINHIKRQLQVSALQQKLQQLHKKNIQLKQELAQRIQVEKTLILANRKLQYWSKTDSLTDIANRRQFDITIEKEWRILEREKQPLSLIMIDVDYFKLYNDTYGHQKGDSCLRQVAKNISFNLKRPADLVARYGGEEFAVILPRTDLVGALHVANQIHLTIRRLQIPHKSSPISEYVTISQGITSMIPNSKRSPESIISLADLAVYQAKQQGRDQIVDSLKCQSRSIN